MNTYYKLGAQTALIKLSAGLPGSSMKSNLAAIGGMSGGGGIKPTGTPLSPGGLKNPLVGGGGVKTFGLKPLKPKHEPTAGANISPIGSTAPGVSPLQNLVTQGGHGDLAAQSMSSPARRLVGNPL